MYALFSGHRGLLRTKNEIKGEAYEITREVRQLENTYKTLYKPIETMAETYYACKNEVFFSRYKSLKVMIKTRISTHAEVKKNEMEESDKSENNQHVKGINALLDVANETMDIMEEVEPLQKPELLQLIEDKKIKREWIKGTLPQLGNCIQSLQTEYTTSKQQHPAARYKHLKNMVKVLIRTADLKP